jgi:hypothetical protein
MAKKLLEIKYGANDLLTLELHKESEVRTCDGAFKEQVKDPDAQGNRPVITRSVT